MIDPAINPSLWPYLPILERLALALALGLFIGLERERRGKEAGLRTFAFVALLGAIGILVGQAFALLALGLIGVLVVLLNVHTMRLNRGIELTTSAALLVTGYIGILAGLGHTLTPTALGVATAALLAWKEQLSGFSLHLTERELRSGILLAILAFVIYPALPTGTVDPYHLLNPREAWTTVILIAAIGFVNYILLKAFGTRGIALAGFLGGLVNSSVTSAELANRDRDAGGRLRSVTYQGVMLATAAMVVRNVALLLLLAPLALVAVLPAFVLMLAASLGLALFHRHPEPAHPVHLSLASPFSIRSALQYGAVFLILQVAGDLAQRGLGQSGFYVVSLIGGLVSSASAVASAGLLASDGVITMGVAGTGATIALLASALANLLLVAKLSADRPLIWRLSWTLTAIVVLGVVGAMVGSRVISGYLPM